MHLHSATTKSSDRRGPGLPIPSLIHSSERTGGGGKRGARLILEFFLFFFGFFFVFWASHVFSFFFWYFPFILLDFPVNSDVFFTFVLFFLAVPCVSYFFGFLFLRAVLGRGVAVRGVILKNKKAGGGLGGGRSASPPDALGVVAFVRVACLVLFFRFFLCSYGKRCGGERSHP